MRFSTIALSMLLFASGMSKAQSGRPLLPAPWTPFTSSSDSSLIGIKSIAIPPISMEGAKLSFELRIQNPNSKPIRCLATKFSANLGKLGDSCQTAPFSIYVDGNDGLGSIEIPANSTTEVKYVGNKEREESGRALGNIDLEFCSRDAWDLGCGYDCGYVEGVDRKYSREPWEELITGGKRKFICEASGEAKRTSDSVICDRGYSADPINDRCLKKCDDTHRAGDSWERGIDFGKVISQCLTSGQISSLTSCKINPLYAAVGETCVPASCGATPHGQPYVTRLTDFGVYTAECSHGQPIKEQLTCNTGAIKENDYCRQKRACGPTHPDGDTYSFFIECSGPCTEGPGKNYTHSCNDGTDSVTITGSCELKPNCRIIGPSRPEP